MSKSDATTFDANSTLESTWEIMERNHDHDELFDRLMKRYQLTHERFIALSNDSNTPEGRAFGRDEMALSITRYGFGQQTNPWLQQVMLAIDACTQILYDEHPDRIIEHDPTTSPHVALAARESYAQWFKQLDRYGTAPAILPVIHPKSWSRPLSVKDIERTQVYVVDDDVAFLTQSVMCTRAIDPEWLDLIPTNALVLTSPHAAMFASSAIKYFPEFVNILAKNPFGSMDEGVSNLAHSLAPIVGMHYVKRDNTFYILPLLDNVQAFALSELAPPERGLHPQTDDDMREIIHNWTDTAQHIPERAQRHQLFPMVTDCISHTISITFEDDNHLNNIVAESVGVLRAHAAGYTPYPLMLMWLAALFGLMRHPEIVEQHVDMLGQRPIPKAERTVDPKTGRRRKTEDVSITTVRVSQGKGSAHTCAPSERTYHHHWIVSGHWRMQPYGPRQSLRKPVWIEPHIQGPLDKPLLLRDHVVRIKL